MSFPPGVRSRLGPFHSGAADTAVSSVSCPTLTGLPAPDEGPLGPAGLVRTDRTLARSGVDRGAGRDVRLESMGHVILSFVA